MFVPEPHKKIHPSSFQVSSNKPVHNHVQQLRVPNSHRAQSNLADSMSMEDFGQITIFLWQAFVNLLCTIFIVASPLSVGERH